jgi:hypothetical protein
MKFKTYNKGRFTQYFGGSPATNPTQYTTRGQDGHSGVDSQLGWNAPIVCDNDSYVYKVILSNQSKENWQGVYMLVDLTDEITMEICQGHFNKILVNEGEWIPENAVIGLEGNRGYVFSGGTQITPEMQKAGDQRGHHVHTAYRPCRKVKSTKRTEYYLLDVNGKKYKDKKGYYYQIINKDNGYKGCVNPFLYSVFPDNDTQKLSMVRNVLSWFIKRTWG